MKDVGVKLFKVKTVQTTHLETEHFLMCKELSKTTVHEQDMYIRRKAYE